MITSAGRCLPVMEGPMARYGLSWDPQTPRPWVPKTLLSCRWDSEPTVAWCGAEEAKTGQAGAHASLSPPPCNGRPNLPPQPEPRMQSLPGKRAFPWSSSAMMQPTDQIITEAEECRHQSAHPKSRPRGWGLGPTPAPHGHTSRPSWPGALGRAGSRPRSYGTLPL